MATNVNVYDRASNTVKALSVDIGTATVNGSHAGKSSYYITVSTSARDPRGNVIVPITLTNANITSGVNEAVNAAVISIFNSLMGNALPDDGDESSSSSSVTSAKSHSTQHLGSSSSSRSSHTPSSQSSGPHA